MSFPHRTRVCHFHANNFSPDASDLCDSRAILQVGFGFERMLIEDTNYTKYELHPYCVHVCGWESLWVCGVRECVSVSARSQASARVQVWLVQPLILSCTHLSQLKALPSYWYRLDSWRSGRQGAASPPLSRDETALSCPPASISNRFGRWRSKPALVINS